MSDLDMSDITPTESLLKWVAIAKEEIASKPVSVEEEKMAPLKEAADKTLKSFLKEAEDNPTDGAGFILDLFNRPELGNKTKFKVCWEAAFGTGALWALTQKKERKNSD